LNISEYFSHIRNQFSTFPFTGSIQITEDIRTSSEGFIKGNISFVDGSELSFREYVSTESEPPKRYSYSFHYSKNQSLIFRYDNAPHHKEISSFPHHKHLKENEVLPCSIPTIETILTEIKNIIASQ